jgi:hypothetical protein
MHEHPPSVEAIDDGTAALTILLQRVETADDAAPDSQAEIS